MKEQGFLGTLKIAAFEFSKYEIFLKMKGSRVLLNRILFVLIISIFYVVSFNKSFKQLEEFNQSKYQLFEDITFSNSTLNIQNSPVIFTPSVFKSNEFIFIGDTRDEFNINEYSEYDTYRRALILTKDSIIFKNRLNEITLKYSDIMFLNSPGEGEVITKDMFFNSIEVVTAFLKNAIYIVFPISMIFDYFLFAFITSLFAFMFMMVSRFRASFSQVYKMILFAQTVPYLIISIFEIISDANGIRTIFPVHILEFLTLLVFIISMYSIKRNQIKNNKNVK